jgi:hypothetical protein
MSITMMNKTFSPKLRPVFKYFFTIIFGLVIGLLMIEILGRAVVGFKPLPAWAQNFNNRVGYELRPHASYTYVSKSGEFDTPVQDNRRGLHDVEHSLDKPDGVFRILILGDSYAQAREVPLETNFARQLEALLNQDAPPGRTYEVINGGHFGLGTTQEYLYYTVEGRRYHPDLVLLGFYVGNDVLDNHAPLIRAWHQQSTVYFPYFAPDGTLHQPGMAPQQRLLSWLRQNFYVVHVLADVVAGNSEAKRVEVGDPDAVSEHTLRIPMGVYQLPDATWLDAWAVTNHALETLNTAVEQDGAQFAVFVIPDRRQIYDEDWQAALAKVPDLDASSLDREQPTRTVMTLLATQQIPALDLLSVFRAAQERLYFPVDGHFNPAGHTLTAQELARWLQTLLT